MNYLERIARRATGLVADETSVQPRVRTVPDGPDPQELPEDDFAAPTADASASTLPSAQHKRKAAPWLGVSGQSAGAQVNPSSGADRPSSASKAVLPQGAEPAHSRFRESLVGPETIVRNPPSGLMNDADTQMAQQTGEERVVHVTRRVLHETAHEVASASHPNADGVGDAERNRAPATPPAEPGHPLVASPAARDGALDVEPNERTAQAQPAPDYDLRPIQHLEDLLHQIPGQAEPLPVAAPEPPARPSVIIRRLVVEVTPPERPVSPRPRVRRRGRDAGAWPNRTAVSSSRLRFGLGQS